MFVLLVQGPCSHSHQETACPLLSQPPAQAFPGRTEKEIAPYTNAGLAHDLGEERGSNILASTGGGKTFERIGQVRIPGTRVDERIIVERRDGSLWMRVRNTGGIAQSSSNDGGRTWSAGELLFKGPTCASKRFFLRRLPSDALLLVRNDAPDGSRSHLTAFISDDERESSYPDGTNAFPLQGGLDAAATAGRELARAVERALPRAERLSSSPLGLRSTEIQFPLQPPPSVARCRELLAAEQQPDRRQRFADLLAMAERGEPRSLRMPLRAIAIGDACLLGLAHEPFAEYHHFANEVSPFAHTMVAAYTNGLECYIGTKRDYDLGENGGYETSPRGAAFQFESRLPLVAESESLLRAAIRTLLRELHT